MDDYENKVENGGPVNDNDKMVYYGAKAWVGDKLDTSEQSDANQSFGNVLHDDILDTYKNRDAKSVNSDIRLLSGLDSGLAGDVNSTFAEINAKEAYRQQLALNSSLRSAEIQQGNEIASRIISLPVNTMSIVSDDPNSPDAILLRAAKDKLVENSNECFSKANNSDSRLTQTVNVLLGVIYIEAADNMPEHLSLGDVSTASTGLFGKEIQGEAKAAEKISQETSKLDEVSRLANNYNLDEGQYVDHIVERHGADSSVLGKSKFNPDYDIKSGIDDTLKSPDSIIKPNTNDRSGYIFEKSYDEPIGTSKNGKPLNTQKVVIDENGNVITSFPK